MIGYLKGKLLSYEDATALVLNNGIGYGVTCSSEMLAKLIADGEGEIYTYLAVREDAISLYGFISKEEKSMFLKLITVSGVGPKMGITVLSNMSLKDLAVKIATSDIKGLATVKGLGKKTAERIIVELREKVDAELSEKDVKSVKEDVKIQEENQDAVIALSSLGFTKQEITSALKQAKESGAQTLEQLIAFALKNIK
jgi:Holliday junction DNA helicase RuvA